jgi:hypothetical protein
MKCTTSMCVALPKCLCFRSFKNQNMFSMSTWKPSFHNAVVDNVGGHPIFHAILANASVSDAVVKIIFELLMAIERKDSVHVQ